MLVCGFYRFIFVVNNTLLDGFFGFFFCFSFEFRTRWKHFSLWWTTQRFATYTDNRKTGKWHEHSWNVANRFTHRNHINHKWTQHFRFSFWQFLIGCCGRNEGERNCAVHRADDFGLLQQRNIVLLFSAHKSQPSHRYYRAIKSFKYKIINITANGVKHILWLCPTFGGFMVFFVQLLPNEITVQVGMWRRL